MANLYICTLIYLQFFTNLFSTPIKSRRVTRFEWPKINEHFNMTSHLNFEHIRKICISRYSICKSNVTRVCAVRYVEGSLQYSDFDNSCYLFLSNMCENPGNEHHIVSGGSCKSYKASRRSDDNVLVTEDNLQDVTTIATTSVEETTLNTQILRQQTTTEFVTLYSIETAFDEHICPLSCPNLYQPICLSANRGFGEHFKFFTFVNHCLGDQYYCKHWEDFAPPEDESEMVTSSPLSWSFCGASRYIQFARFSEVASSMGHYGWLLGDQKATHIMEPHERLRLSRG